VATDKHPTVLPVKSSQNQKLSENYGSLSGKSEMQDTCA